MLTKDDKKFITEILDLKINEALDKKFKENNDILVKDILDLFTVTNSRIDKVNENLSERIDKVLDQLKDHNDIIDTHERRIEKVEEKVFSISA
ncbi:MAG: hypothetical protein AAB437_00320 [Patescibacteria group bacterium]